MIVRFDAINALLLGRKVEESLALRTGSAISLYECGDHTAYEIESVVNVTSRQTVVDNIEEANGLTSIEDIGCHLLGI